MAKLRAVLVGTGGWAEAHAAAYRDCSDVELVGICGHRNAERLNSLADKYGIPERSLSLRELLAKTEPDILDIACNPHFRLEGVRAAILPCIKLINLEKPMALTPGEAYEIERLCLENDKLLVVNHQKKFLPAWRKAKDTIASGAIGEINFIHSSCQGNLLEQGTHLVDMTLFFNDYRPVSWVMGQIDELEGLDKEGASAPDAALAMVCFENGVRATMEFGSIGHGVPGETNKWHHFSVEVYGSRGHIKVALNKTLEVTTYADGKTAIEESSWDKHYIRAETEHLDAAARYARDPSVGHISDLPKSLASFQVIMGIYESGCGGGRVELPRHFDDSLMDRLNRLRERKE
ncbi:MAG: Gfo/Idh/MocA family protein [bacterium]